MAGADCSVRLPEPNPTDLGRGRIFREKQASRARDHVVRTPDGLAAFRAPMVQKSRLLCHLDKQRPEFVQFPL